MADRPTCIHGARTIIDTYLGQWVTVSYVEEGQSKSAQGKILDFDNINFIRIVGDYTEKLISTANVTSIKKIRRSNESP